ncbi:MAG: hypothetical protein WC866_03110 [Patescibacteria group bacterium]|jgi:hypothetical protein
MRLFSLFLIFTALACGGSSKTAKHGETTSLSVRLGAQSPYIAFSAPDWHRDPGNAQPDQIVLHHSEHNGVGMALWVVDANPGSTVEATNTQFGMMLLTAPLLFKVTEVSDPEYLSDEEAIFLIRGTDWKKGTKMVALCRVKIVSGHGAAYWVKMITFGPEARLAQLGVATYRVLQSLHVEP